MDRAALARERRKDEAHEALVFEREREAALRWQLAEIALTADGSGVDDAAFARMEPDEVEIVRALLGARVIEELVGDDWLDEDFLTADASDDDSAADDGAETEAEIARLLGEIAEAERRQGALERFIAAIDSLSEPSG